MNIDLGAQVSELRSRLRQLPVRERDGEALLSMTALWSCWEEIGLPRDGEGAFGQLEAALRHHLALVQIALPGGWFSFGSRPGYPSMECRRSMRRMAESGRGAFGSACRIHLLSPFRRLIATKPFKMGRGDQLGIHLAHIQLAVWRLGCGESRASLNTARCRSSSQNAFCIHANAKGEV